MWQLGWWHCQAVQSSWHGLAISVFWHDRPELSRVSGKHEGPTLQGLGWSACVPKYSSLQLGQALHICCMVSAPQSLNIVPYYEIPMPISRLRLLMQFRMGSHALPVEQGRLANPLPRSQSFKYLGSVFQESGELGPIAAASFSRPGC